MLFCSRSNHVLNIIVSSKFWQSCVFWFGVSNITCFLGQIFPHVTMLLSFFFFFLNVGKTCVFFRGDWRFISKASFWVLGFGCFLKMEALGFCGLIWPKCWFFEVCHHGSLWPGKWSLKFFHALSSDLLVICENSLNPYLLVLKNCTRVKWVAEL